MIFCCLFLCLLLSFVCVCGGGCFTLCFVCFLFLLLLLFFLFKFPKRFIFCKINFTGEENK